MSTTDEEDRGTEGDSASRSSTSTKPTSRAKKKALPLWQEVILLLGTALVLAILVKTFLVQAFYIPSGSMEQTLEVNDRILVQKVTYWTGDVHRGDIVVFDDPGGWLTASEDRQPHNAVQKGLELFGLFPTGGHLVKRVIGVGGDEVQCCDKQGRIMVNGVALDEDYLAKGVKPSTIRFDVNVPDGRLWVMGDNRPFSSDSRAHMGGPGGGYVDAGDVVGKVWATVWPASRFAFNDDPKIFDDPALDGDGQ